MIILGSVFNFDCTAMWWNYEKLLLILPLISIGLLGFFLSWQYGSCYSWIAQKLDITGRIAPVFFIGCGAGGFVFPPISGLVFTWESWGPIGILHLTLIVCLIQVCTPPSPIRQASFCFQTFLSLQLSEQNKSHQVITPFQRHKWVQTKLHTTFDTFFWHWRDFQTIYGPIGKKYTTLS